MYLPRLLFGSSTGADQATLFLALGNSCSLFILTIIEALPTFSQSLFPQQFNISYLYRTVLWLLSIHTVLVVPSLIGSALATAFGHHICDCTTSSAKSSFDFDRDNKNYPILNWRQLPWWLRFTLTFFRIVFNNIFYNGILYCCYSGRSDRRNSIAEVSSTTKILPVHDDSKIRTTTGEIINNPLSTIPPRTNNESRQQLLTVFGGTLGIFTGVCGLSIIGPLVVQPMQNETTILSLIVSWICAMGLLISSILNGFGSVLLPYTYLSGLFLQRVRPDYIIKLEAELRSIQENLVKKRTMLRELKVEVSTLSPLGGSSRSSLTGTSNNTFSKGAKYVMSSLLMQNNTNCLSELSDELKNRRQILQTEIGFMEDLFRETTFDLEELKCTQTLAAASRTFIGKIKSSVGILFSAILMVRLLNAGFSIWRSYDTLFNTEYALHRHKKSQSDIVTTTLLWLAGHKYVSQNHYNMLSQLISLLLSSLLSFTQIRTLLRTVNMIHRRLSGFYKKCYCSHDVANDTGLLTIDHSDQKGSLNFIWQIIALFVGCYSLACTVLIKMMLPEKFSVAFLTALDETGIFTIHSSLVNMVFFSSSIISTAFLGMLLGIQRQNILRHASMNDKICSLPDV